MFLLKGFHVSINGKGWIWGKAWTVDKTGQTYICNTGERCNRKTCCIEKLNIQLCKNFARVREMCPKWDKCWKKNQSSPLGHWKHGFLKFEFLLFQMPDSSQNIGICYRKAWIPLKKENACMLEKRRHYNVWVNVKKGSQWFQGRKKRFCTNSSSSSSYPIEMVDPLLHGQHGCELIGLLTPYSTVNMAVN